ncbi:MAG TPA: hypothetical protein VKI44_25665, partial [Acetobacteraceae bacterium]|nr:hypothetical protein [Acetobacteraceae bacterium]
MSVLRAIAAAGRKAPKLSAIAAMMIVLVSAAELRDHWWQGMFGADAKPLAVSRAAPTETAQVQTPAAPTIPVVRPKVQTVSDSLEITGNAAAVNQVKLIARVVGFLEQIHFEDGALVRKGDLLFTIQ